jgi:hypothetical protein
VRRLAPLVLAALFSAAPAGADRSPGWTTYGNSDTRAGFVSTPAAAFARRWFAPIEGRATSQALVARDVPAPGLKTVYQATSSGRINAVAPDGYVRWTVDLGQLPRPCPQLDGYGITGTPAIDPGAQALYAVDPFGRLHALDLATGAELEGWPVRIFADYRQEHVFGAIAVIRGFVYVPTASYCDNPMEGKLIRVARDTRELTSWTSVPLRLGGGGGIWGFGGAAYSSSRDSLYVATGNAFEGGENVGKRFKEWAGLGEHLVELSPDLHVRAASHPVGLTQKLDLDFGSSPVVFRRAGCPEQVAALNKNGTLYGWRGDRVAAGPLWAFELRRLDPRARLIAQPAWSPRLASLFVTTGTRLVRLSILRSCRPRAAWSRALGPFAVQGSPTVAGDTVWLSPAGKGEGLLGFDGRTGRLVARAGLGGDGFAGPTVVDGSLYLGTFAGGMHGFLARSVVAGRAETQLPQYSSFADGAHGWVSRESGVYATEDGGGSWHRIHRFYALRVVRLSATSGMISSGLPAALCNCRTRELWTDDNGRHWHEAALVGPLFQGRGRSLYWADRSGLSRAAWPPRGPARRVSAVKSGRVVALANAPGGIVALVSNRLHGKGWDRAPRVLVARGGRTKLYRLPTARGRAVLVRSLAVGWPAIAVTGTDYLDESDTGTTSVVWSSRDGGSSWTVERR